MNNDNITFDENKINKVIEAVPNLSGNFNQGLDLFFSENIVLFPLKPIKVNYFIKKSKYFLSFIDNSLRLSKSLRDLYVYQYDTSNHPLNFSSPTLLLIIFNNNNVNFNKGDLIGRAKIHLITNKNNIKKELTEKFELSSGKEFSFSSESNNYSSIEDITENSKENFKLQFSVSKEFYLKEQTKLRNKKHSEIFDGSIVENIKNSLINDGSKNKSLNFESQLSKSQKLTEKEEKNVKKENSIKKQINENKKDSFIFSSKKRKFKRKKKLITLPKNDKNELSNSHRINSLFNYDFEENYIKEFKEISFPKKN